MNIAFSKKINFLVSKSPEIRELRGEEAFKILNKHILMHFTFCFVYQKSVKIEFFSMIRKLSFHVHILILCNIHRKEVKILITLTKEKIAEWPLKRVKSTILEISKLMKFYERAFDLYPQNGMLVPEEYIREYEICKQNLELLKKREVWLTTGLNL